MYRWRQFLVLMIGGAVASFAIYLLLAFLIMPFVMAWYFRARNFDLDILIWDRRLIWAAIGAGYLLCLLKVDWAEIGEGPLFKSGSRSYPDDSGAAESKIDASAPVPGFPVLERNIRNLAAMKKTAASPKIDASSRATIRKAAAKLAAVIRAQQRRILSAQRSKVDLGK